MSIDVKRLHAFTQRLRSVLGENTECVIVGNDDDSVSLRDIERLLAVYEAARRVRWAAHALQQAEESPRSRPFDGGVWQTVVQRAQFELDEAIGNLAVAVDAADGPEKR